MACKIAFARLQLFYFLSWYNYADMNFWCLQVARILLFIFFFYHMIIHFDEVSGCCSLVNCMTINHILDSKFGHFFFNIETFWNFDLQNFIISQYDLESILTVSWLMSKIKEYPVTFIYKWVLNPQNPSTLFQFWQWANWNGKLDSVWLWRQRATFCTKK